MTNTTLHAHVARSQSDCDGPTYDTYVVGISDEERQRSIDAAGINDFTDIEFRERVTLSIMSVYACESGTLTVSKAGVHWHEVTEEGYRQAEVSWCEDESCDPNARTHRDVFAESMNY